MLGLPSSWNKIPSEVGFTRNPRKFPQQSNRASRSLRIEFLEDRRLLATDLATVVPNLDFEQYTALPTGLSQLNKPGNRVVDWAKLTAATTDYMHVDGWTGTAHPQSTGIAPAPINGSKGFVGILANEYPGHSHEYAVNILSAPLMAGEEYQVDLWAGAPGSTGGGPFSGELVIYGFPDSSVIPLPNYFTNEVRDISQFVDASDYVELLAVQVDLAENTWESFPNQTFTPTVAIEAIVFGARSDGVGNHYVIFDAAGSTPPTADFDVDGDVDGIDFLSWQRGLGMESGATLVDGDADGDSDVDSADLAIWEAQYCTNTPSSITEDFVSDGDTSDHDAMPSDPEVLESEQIIASYPMEGEEGGDFSRVLNSSTVLEIVNSTITENIATSQTGGIHNPNGDMIILHNRFLPGNTAGASTTDNAIGDLRGSMMDPGSFNLVGTVSGRGLTHGVDGNMVGVTDHRLGVLADNGGSTLAYALLADSPAIEAGSDSRSIALGLFAAQRGGSRFEDGDNNGFARVDIGALEIVFAEL